MYRSPVEWQQDKGELVPSGRADQRISGVLVVLTGLCGFSLVSQLPGTREKNRLLRGSNPRPCRTLEVSWKLRSFWPLERGDLFQADVLRLA